MLLTEEKFSENIIKFAVFRYIYCISYNFNDLGIHIKLALVK
jgi:hypothetical protein